MNKENEHVHPIHQQKRSKEGNPTLWRHGHYAK